MSSQDASLLLQLCEQPMARILSGFGKQYTLLSQIPRGLPRYRTAQQCYRNAQLAVLDDQRLTYVEGVARGDGAPFKHAWVTMDGKYAIDLTLRKQKMVLADHTVWLHPPTFFLGVEIPTQDVRRLMVANACHTSILKQWHEQIERPRRQVVHLLRKFARAGD